MWFELIKEYKHYPLDNKELIAISRDVNFIKQWCAIVYCNDLKWQSVDLYNVHVAKYDYVTLTIRPLTEIKVLELPE